MLLSPKNKTILNGIITNNNIANSYIFIGPEEACISESALWFAKKILQTTQQLNQNEIKVINNPDLIEVTPEKKQLSIEEIKTLQKKIKYGPTQYQKKIIIIHKSDTMTNSAANAFLKTLEEPPENTHFILLTNNLYTLLPTIRSRSQLINLSSSPNETLTSLLSKLTITDTPKIEKKFEHYTHLLPIIQTNKFDEVKELILSYDDILKLSKHKKIEYAGLLSKDKSLTEKCILCWVKDIWNSMEIINKKKQHHLELMIENISQIKYNLNLRLHIEGLLLQIN